MIKKMAEKSISGKKGAQKSTSNATSKTSTKSSSSKKAGGGKSKSKSKTGDKRKSGPPKSYKKLHNSIKMPRSVATSSPRSTTSKIESVGVEKSKSGRKGAKSKLIVEQPAPIKETSTVDKSASVVKSSKVDLKTAFSKLNDHFVQPVPSSKCSDFEKGEKSSAVVSSKPSSNKAVDSSLNTHPPPKIAPKVVNMVVKSSFGVKTSTSTAVSGTASPAPPLPSSILLGGSTFKCSVQNDDSALALVMHTAHDEGPVKRDETEMFVPGKGELRSTQPEPPEQQ